MTDSVLIDARDVGFSTPVILPQERSILTNPANLLADFYFNKPSRHSHALLSNITFSLSSGQRIGIIGPNGAGKSTLLRVLGGIYEPTQGTLTMNCSPRGLFDISMGFVGEATGLENIYLRGLEMGHTMPHIRSKIPEIIEFSELGDAIDKPFSTFSSGMRLRLAVALALIEQPDVMLLDEWIGAGDATFQNKVAARMNALVDGSRGLMLASHNDALLKRVCTHGLVMQKGRVVFQGGINEALSYYHQNVRPTHKTEKSDKADVPAAAAKAPPAPSPPITPPTTPNAIPRQA
ncbi:MAG: ABC transporter ATP-binding protein [Hyphomicrobium sp.]